MKSDRIPRITSSPTPMPDIRPIDLSTGWAKAVLKQMGLLRYDHRTKHRLLAQLFGQSILAPDSTRIALNNGVKPLYPFKASGVLRADFSKNWKFIREHLSEGPDPLFHFESISVESTALPTQIRSTRIRLNRALLPEVDLESLRRETLYCAEERAWAQFLQTWSDQHPDLFDQRDLDCIFRMMMAGEDGLIPRRLAAEFSELIHRLHRFRDQIGVRVAYKHGPRFFIHKEFRARIREAIPFHELDIEALGFPDSVKEYPWDHVEPDDDDLFAPQLRALRASESQISSNEADLARIDAQYRDYESALANRDRLREELSVVRRTLTFLDDDLREVDRRFIAVQGELIALQTRLGAILKALGDAQAEIRRLEVLQAASSNSTEDVTDWLEALVETIKQLPPAHPPRVVGPDGIDLTRWLASVHPTQRFEHLDCRDIAQAELWTKCLLEQYPPKMQLGIPTFQTFLFHLLHEARSGEMLRSQLIQSLKTNAPSLFAHFNNSYFYGRIDAYIKRTNALMPEGTAPILSKRGSAKQFTLVLDRTAFISKLLEHPLIRIYVHRKAPLEGGELDLLEEIFRDGEVDLYDSDRELHLINKALFAGLCNKFPTGFFTSRRGGSKVALSRNLKEALHRL